MNRKQREAFKYVGILAGSATAILVAFGLIAKRAIAETSETSQGGEALPPTSITTLPTAPVIPAAGGGIVFGPDGKVSGPVSVVTVPGKLNPDGTVSPIQLVPGSPVSPVIISDDPIIREEQINTIAETTNIPNEVIDIVGVTPQTITTNTGDGVMVEEVFVTDDGRVLTPQQVLTEFINTAEVQEGLGSLQAGTGKSVLQSLFDGSPINITNFLTERPLGFPKAPIDSEFQRRAQALGPGLTVSNPGASSAAGIPNFSRLAALGVDLSEVDLFGVQNPEFLRDIKSGTGPLSPAEKALVQEQVTRNDPRNFTFADKKEISDNIAARKSEKLREAERSSQLTAAGFNEADAKAFLKSKGFNVQGSLTAGQFVAIERSLAERPPFIPARTAVVLPAERPLNLASFVTPDANSNLTPEERAAASIAALRARGGFGT